MRERFSQLGMLDVDRVIAGLELTRFPVPDVGEARDTSGVAGLVRAADLIGQLGDPNYSTSSTKPARTRKWDSTVPRI